MDSSVSNAPGRPSLFTPRDARDSGTLKRLGRKFFWPLWLLYMLALLAAVPWAIKIGVMYEIWVLEL